MRPSHFLQINLEMVLEEEEKGRTDVFIKPVVEFGLRSGLEGVLDDKGEVEEREGEEKEEDDSGRYGTLGVEDSRSTNSTNELQ